VGRLLSEVDARARSVGRRVARSRRTLKALRRAAGLPEGLFDVRGPSALPRR
jgi:hypothetical protein